MHGASRLTNRTDRLQAMAGRRCLSPLLEVSMLKHASLLR